MDMQAVIPRISNKNLELYREYSSYYSHICIGKRSHVDNVIFSITKKAISEEKQLRTVSLYQHTIQTDILLLDCYVFIALMINWQLMNSLCHMLFVW